MDEPPRPVFPTGARSAGRSNRSCARSILWVVLAALAVWPRAAQGQWDRPIDWLIPCTAFIEETFGADHPLCDDIHPETGIKATLDAASLWLEGLGFASPAISANLDLAHHMQKAAEDQQALQVANQWDPRCEERYCAWLVYGLGGKHGAYSWGDSSMALDPFRVTEDGPKPGYDDGFGFAEVHELFHAVQAGYSDVGTALDNDYIRWILEGSAEHAERAAGRQIGISVKSSVRLRTYDGSLHVPPNEDPDSPDFKAWAYGSWEFFEFLGDYLGSEGEMSYLDYLFENLAPAQENGLEAVEAAVRRESGAGLYEAFPEFVTRRLDRPCYFSQLGTWNDLDCADGADNEHRFSLAFPDTVRRLQHTASDIAANGYLVRMEVPEEKEGRLTIRVPPDQDEEYLHLAVDDMRRDAPGTTGLRNEYTTELPPGPHEFLVRLANIPRDLSEVDVSPGLDLAADDPAPIEFILVELDARWTLTVSGGPAPGTYRGDRAVASIDRAGRITSVGLYTGTDVQPDVWVGVVSSVHGESVWAPADQPDDDAGYEPGVPARRGTFEVILNYGEPERVHLDVDSFKAERIGLSTVWPHYPPTVEIRRVTEETVEGFAEGAFSEQKTLDQAGTMRVEFRARACRVGDPDFSACTSLQPVSW